MEETATAKRVRKKIAQVVDYKKVFGSEQGKRVLYDLMTEHKVMSPTFIKGDPIEMAFLEGQRNVILRIFALLKLNPEQIKQKLQEADQYVNSN